MAGVRALVGMVALCLGLTACGTDATTATPAPSVTPPTAPAPTPTTAAALEPNAVIERVVDGDTVVVDLDGTRERVRLIGIDTPESVAENRPDQCYGAEASDYLTELLPPDTPVTLILDVEPRDRYDRLLAYLVRTQDQLFVNLDLIERGYAGTLSHPPNTHYADLFEDAVHLAAEERVGLWGTCGGPDVPLE